MVQPTLFLVVTTQTMRTISFRLRKTKQTALFKETLMIAVFLPACFSAGTNYLNTSVKGMLISNKDPEVIAHAGTRSESDLKI